MEIRDKNILLVSPESWDHIFVSKHHYAVHLALRGNRVYFLNPPKGNESISKTDFDNVYTVHYPGFTKGLRFYPPLLQKYFIRKKFNSLEKLCATKFDIIWSFDNSVFFDFEALPKDVLKICHIVDLSQNFQTRKAAQTADYCFCNTDLIKIRLSKHNSHVYKINHGFNVQITDNVNLKLPGRAKVKALYAGNLAIPYIDWGLLLQCIKTERLVDFIFVGPGSEDPSIMNFIQQLRGMENCFFVQQISAQELQKYYKAADVLLICYKEEFQANQVTNTHKMMEYLGSGKMVVATHTAEYDDLAKDGLFLMSFHNSEFTSKLKQAFDELEKWNSEKKQQARKVFALDNSYEAQIKRIEQLIK